jgi:pimeloyl-ACP methyl ester carboxylesterase
MSGRLRIACLALLGCATLHADEATSTTTMVGHHAGGAPWAVDMPGSWNGTLLLYGHGYSPGASSQPPVTAPRGLREWLLSRGYALAASSYSGSGWALEEAPRDQLEVLDAFIARFGKPRRAIAWGDSMGGLVSVALAERQPDRFAAALPMCGSVSGSLGMLNTALDGAFAFRTLLAPDSGIRLAGIDDDRANAALASAALDAAWPSAQGRARVVLAASLAQLPTWTDPRVPQPDPQNFDAQAAELRKAFVAGTFLPRVDQQRRAHGNYSWNTGIDYRKQLQRSGRLRLVQHFYQQAGLDLEQDLATLNAAPRVVADAAAVAYMRANYVPSGDLRIPLLTLQTLGDGMTVPATHGSLRELVRAAGRQRQLAQLYVRRAGHCTFTPAEIVAALRTLEHRLDNGRWEMAPAMLQQRGADATGDMRFVDLKPDALLRHCGARSGSCSGEPQP